MDATSIFLATLMGLTALLGIGALIGLLISSWYILLPLFLLAAALATVRRRSRAPGGRGRPSAGGDAMGAVSGVAGLRLRGGCCRGPNPASHQIVDGQRLREPGTGCHSADKKKNAQKGKSHQPNHVIPRFGLPAPGWRHAFIHNNERNVRLFRLGRIRSIAMTPLWSRFLPGGRDSEQVRLHDSGDMTMRRYRSAAAPLALLALMAMGGCAHQDIRSGLLWGRADRLQERPCRRQSAAHPVFRLHQPQQRLGCLRRRVLVAAVLPVPSRKLGQRRAAVLQSDPVIAAIRMAGRSAR